MNISSYLFVPQKSTFIFFTILFQNSKSAVVLPFMSYFLSFCDPRIYGFTARASLKK